MVKRDVQNSLSRFTFLLYAIAIVMAAALCLRVTYEANAQVTADFENIEGYDPGDISDQNGWIVYFNAPYTPLNISASDQYSGLYSLNIASTSYTQGIKHFFATSTTFTQCFYLNIPILSGTRALWITLDHSNNYNYPNAIFKISDTNWIYGLSNTNTYNTITQGSGWTKMCFHLRDSQYITYQVNSIFTPEYTVNNVAGNPPDTLKIISDGSGTINAFIDFFTTASTSVPLNTEIIDLPGSENDPNVEIISPALYEGICATEPCAKLKNNPKYCYIDREEICTLEFEFNDWFTDGTYANAIIPPGGLADDMVGFTVIHDTDGGFDEINLPNPGVATTTEYGLYFEIPGWGDYRIGTYMVEWVSFAEIDTGLTEECNCNDVATSTGVFDEFRYGIECGGHMLACWAFYPSQSKLDKIQITYLNMFNKFPLKPIYQVKDLFVALSATTSNPASLPISGLATSTGLATLNGLDILPLTDYDASDVIYPLVNKVREILVFIVYLILAMYFVYRIFLILGHNPFHSEKQESINEKNEIAQNKNLQINLRKKSRSNLVIDLRK